MGKIVFKRLAEVQILHDYFLTMADGTSFFEKNKSEKEKFLDQRINQGLYYAGSIFKIAPITAERLRDNKILFAETASGFILGVEVDEVIDAGELRFKPVHDISKKLNLSFSMVPRLPYFKSLTSLVLDRSFPSIYFFTNKKATVLNENTVPAYTSLPLSKKALSPQAGEFYEMGTILNFGGNIREANQRTDGNDPLHWEDIEERRFVTRADKILLPHNFHIKFKDDQLVTQAEVSLEDAGNIEIKKIIKNSAEPLQDISLNFTKIDENDENSAAIPSGNYHLKLKINGLPELVYTIILNDDLYERQNFGVVNLGFEEENSPYSLLDSQGFLKTKIEAGGQKISHPIFEIRLRNRRSYWRYKKNTDFTPAEIAATSSHLDVAATNLLVAKKPKALTETLVPFKNGTSLLLPTPKTAGIRVENDKIYSEIYINQSNGLLKI